MKALYQTVRQHPIKMMDATTTHPMGLPMMVPSISSYCCLAIASI